MRARQRLENYGRIGVRVSRSHARAGSCVECICRGVCTPLGYYTENVIHTRSKERTHDESGEGVSPHGHPGSRVGETPDSDLGSRGFGRFALTLCPHNTHLCSESASCCLARLARLRAPVSLSHVTHGSPGPRAARASLTLNDMCDRFGHALLHNDQCVRDWRMDDRSAARTASPPEPAGRHRRDAARSATLYSRVFCDPTSRPSRVPIDASRLRRLWKRVLRQRLAVRSDNLCQARVGEDVGKLVLRHLKGKEVSKRCLGGV